MRLYLQFVFFFPLMQNYVYLIIYCFELHMLVQFSCTHIFSCSTFFIASYRTVLNSIFPYCNLHIFRSRADCECSRSLFFQPVRKLKRGKEKTESSPEVKSCAHKCKLIKSYNSYWHKSLYSRYDGAQNWREIENCSPHMAQACGATGTVNNTFLSFLFSYKSFNYAI